MKTGFKDLSGWLKSVIILLGVGVIYNTYQIYQINEWISLMTDWVVATGDWRVAVGNLLEILVPL